MNMPSGAIRHDKKLALTSKHFHENKFAIYRYLRGHLPVHRVSVFGMGMYATARYDDCLTVLKDDRFGRDRSAITGGSKLPFPTPKSVQLLSNSMIIMDDPEHRRLRTLVHKAFAPKHVHQMEERVESLAHELIDKTLKQSAKGEADIRAEYALDIPVAVISQMMGVSDDEMDLVRNSIRVLSDGLSGWSVIRTFAWDIRKVIEHLRELVARKRKQPGDDILSALIQAEEDGDKLSEDELLSMVFLLIVAGFETTVHLITNGVLTFIDHPDQFERLKNNPELLGSAVEEVLRFSGPIHGTKMNYAKEDVELRGVTIPKGAPVMPLLGSANRDENVFENADQFDIARDPNRHLAFSQGNHFCLGAFLARMETKLAFKVLFERAPNIQLAIPRDQIELERTPGWHRHKRLPVYLNP